MRNMKPYMPCLAPPARDGSQLNAMSCDVEEYFQVWAFESRIERDSWQDRPSRLDIGLGRTLDLFARRQVRATFFVLGWIAERHPQWIRRMVADGHEVASHGYDHTRVTSQSPAQFREDVLRTKKLLEDLGGVEVNGYRAASYSINKSNLWALDVLAETGHRYSSSIYPVRHDLYGVPDAPRFAFRLATSGILEIPVTTTRWLGRNWPCGGGGYFRLWPYAISQRALRRVNGVDGQPAIFYFHPWEMDAAQPRVADAPLKSRFRHYLNLGRFPQRLEQLLADFRWDRIDRVFQIAERSA